MSAVTQILCLQRELGLMFFWQIPGDVFEVQQGIRENNLKPIGDDLESSATDTGNSQP